MSFPSAPALLDAIMLSVVAQGGGTYGLPHYPAGHPSPGTQRVHPVPGAAAAPKDQLLTVYDAPVNGRSRRYYQITAAGRQQLCRLCPRVEPLPFFH